MAYSEQVRQITNRIHAAKDLDRIFVDLTGEILQLLDAERITLYALDFDKREIYSRFVDPDALGDIKEIRVPMDEGSIAGFVAKNRVIINLTDAYDKEELTSVSPSLSFDDSWDKKTGFRTKQMLTVPALANTNLLAGVVQLINKRSKDRFTKEDEDKIQEIGRTLGIALYNQYQLSRKKPPRFYTLESSKLITQDELNTAITEARAQPKAG
ncbi:MAG: GAF domain-containing protein, partial [Dehalococcoidia bacterium]